MASINSVNYHQRQHALCGQRQYGPFRVVCKYNLQVFQRISNTHKYAPFQYSELEHLNKVNVAFAPVNAHNEVKVLELDLVKPWQPLVQQNEVN